MLASPNLGSSERNCSAATAHNFDAVRVCLCVRLAWICRHVIKQHFFSKPNKSAKCQQTAETKSRSPLDDVKHTRPMSCGTRLPIVSRATLQTAGLPNRTYRTGVVGVSKSRTAPGTLGARATAAAAACKHKEARSSSVSNSDIRGEARGKKKTSSSQRACGAPRLVGLQQLGGVAPCLLNPVGLASAGSQLVDPVALLRVPALQPSVI